jgi:hypothetical protein
MRVIDRDLIRGGDFNSSKMVDVQAALAAIEALPDADKEVPVNLQASTEPNGSPEDVAESTGGKPPVEDVAETTSAAE